MCFGQYIILESKTDKVGIEVLNIVSTLHIILLVLAVDQSDNASS
jgi:hypothetical protein